MMKRFLLSAAFSMTAAFAITAQAETLLSRLTQAAASTESEVPDPEKAYLITVGMRDASTLVVRFDIDDCCYLYRNKTKLQLTSADGATTSTDARLGSYTLPAGKVKNDEFVGKTEVYYGVVEIDVPIKGSAGDLALKVDYQGCSEKGVQICFPPMSKVVSIGGASVDAAPPPTGDTASGFWFALVAAFGAGLLLSFTPCVLPMIPILSGVIVGTEGTHLTKLRGGLLSYTYVFGTAVTYAIAGAVAGSTGEQLQAYFQNPWAIGLFSVVLVLLALSMFGLYELQVPAAIQSLLHTHSSRLRSKAKQWVAGEFIGAFLLGLVSALIIGACVSPVLVSALGSAVAARDPWLGAGIMFMLAHGQGLILVAVGVSEGVLLPKAGPWMNTIKHVFGALLLAVAIYLLGYLPQVPVLLLWGALFVVCAVYLGATQRLPEQADGWRYLWKGFGTVLLIWGTLALLGGFAGNRDLFNPLPLSLFGQKTASPAMPSIFERMKTVKQLETRLAQAAKAGKPVLLDYYADWCTDCVRMEKSTFADAEVRTALAEFVVLQADVTDSNDPEVRALKSRFEVYGPPATLFFASIGGEQKELRHYGFLDKHAFLSILQRVH